MLRALKLRGSSSMSAQVVGMLWNSLEIWLQPEGEELTESQVGRGKWKDKQTHEGNSQWKENLVHSHTWKHRVVQIEWVSVKPDGKPPELASRRQTTELHDEICISGFGVEGVKLKSEREENIFIYFTHLHFQSLHFLFLVASLSPLTFLCSVWIVVLSIRQNPIPSFRSPSVFLLSEEPPEVAVESLLQASGGFSHGVTLFICHLNLWRSGTNQAPLCIYVHSVPPTGGPGNLGIHMPSLCSGLL